MFEGLSSKDTYKLRFYIYQGILQHIYKSTTKEELQEVEQQLEWYKKNIIISYHGLNSEYQIKLMTIQGGDENG